MSSLVFVFGPVLVTAAALALFELLARRRRARQHALQEQIACLRCGYSLYGLTLPRCPECGTLRGFKVPMAELGLSESDLKPPDHQSE